MSIQELSEYISQHKDGKSLQYRYNDESIVMQHTRSIFYQEVYITDQHILESCAQANTYEEFIELCRPLAKSDTEAWMRERNRPPQKGRTRRRFK